MLWNELLSQLVTLADTPQYDRIGGLRPFNGDEWTMLGLARWNCEDWEAKVSRINQFFENLKWQITTEKGSEKGSLKVSHRIVKAGETYARWYFSWE